jgi:hypothetical protein
MLCCHTWNKRASVWELQQHCHMRLSLAALSGSHHGDLCKEVRCALARSIGW